MAARAQLCRHAVLSARRPTEQIHAHQRLASQCARGCSLAPVARAAPALAAAKPLELLPRASLQPAQPINGSTNTEHHGGDRPQLKHSWRAGPSNSRSRWRCSGAEREIWDHVQQGNFHQAVAGSHAAYTRWRAGGDPLTPLAQFTMDKRRFRIECLYAGILAGLSMCGPGAGRNTLLGVLPAFYAALLGDQSEQLADLYSSQSEQAARVLDAMLAASTAFHHLTSWCAWKARLCLSCMPHRSQQMVRFGVRNPDLVAGSLPPAIVTRTNAAWMLRKPSEDFVDVETAGGIVADMLRMGVVPDPAVAETLVSSAVRCGKAAAAAPLYTLDSRPMDLPHTALVGLAVLREALGKRQPRIHYDVLGTLVRAGDLDGAITIASAVRSRLMFHLLASQWAARHPGHAQGVDSIVRSALAVLDCKFLRSTHHTAVTSILGATTGPQPGTATPKKELVRRALCLHRELAPRLETLSAPAINRLMQAAFDHNMASAALWVYHDAERRQALCAPRRRFSDDAIIATLAGFFTRQPNLRSFVRFIDVPSRSGLSRRHNLFTAMICELARSPGSKHSVDACGESQNRRPRAGSRVRRFQNAEAVLMLMRKNNIRPPAKAYHAVMHAWATLGQPRKVQWLANLLLADPRGDRQTRIGEVTWDILMYAYMRTHRACRVLGPLKRVRRWLRRHVGRAPAPETAGGHEPITSDLIDMAMSAYIEQGNGAHGKLPVSPGNRRTLGPTTCILAENRRFKQASRVPDDLHAQHTVPEPLVELKALLSHHMRMGDTASVLNVVRRILYHDYKLGCDYWGPVLYQCATLTDTSKLIVFLYEQWCQGLGIDGIAQVPPALVQDANLAYIVRGALRDQNRASDARAMATSPRAAKTPQHPRACTGAASKGASELCAPGRRRKLRLYRALLREIRQMPIPELRGKHMRNVRFVYDLYRDLDAHCPRVGELVREGAAHLKWLRAWHHHTDTCAALARRPEQDS